LHRLPVWASHLLIAPGTIIHELTHLILAVATFQRVVRVQLYNPGWRSNGQPLGVVVSAAPRSPWGVFAKTISGLAPLLAGLMIFPASISISQNFNAPDSLYFLSVCLAGLFSFHAIPSPADFLVALPGLLWTALAWLFLTRLVPTWSHFIADQVLLILSPLSFLFIASSLVSLLILSGTSFLHGSKKS